MSSQFSPSPTDDMVEASVTMEDLDNFGDDAEIDEAEVDEEEEDEEDDDGSYKLRFDADTDPLNFAQQDPSGVELYRQFERLEYEALAERKRNALTRKQQQEETSGEPPEKRRKVEFLGVTAEEINELMNFGTKRKSKRLKKRGRRKGSKSKHNPEITRKIGDATLLYACGEYQEAISLLEEVIQLAPNISDTYHVLGTVYEAMGDKSKALSFIMIAAHLSPKDPAIWKKLVAWSIELKNTGQVRYCLLKAINADPEDLGLRFDLALFYSELGDYQKAAESYENIVNIYPANTEASKLAAKMYEKCGQVEQAIRILQKYVNTYGPEDDISVVQFLIALYMETGAQKKALKLIEHEWSSGILDNSLSSYLSVKKAICMAHLGNMEHVEDFHIDPCASREELTMEVADALYNLRQYGHALKFYLMLENGSAKDNGSLHKKIAECYIFLEEKQKSIPFFYKVITSMEDDVDARITLSSILIEEEKLDEAINLLSVPKDDDHCLDFSSVECKPWWQYGKIKMHLAKVYRAKGMPDEFAETIYTYIRETLIVENMNKKARPQKKLPYNVLSERAKVLDEQKADGLFHGFRPITTPSERQKATRAKKLLEKRAALKEEKKAAALAAGLDWQSDLEDEAPPIVVQEPPLLGFLQDEEHFQLILYLCKALASSRRYPEALEIINQTLRLEYDMLSNEDKEELRSFGAQIAYNTKDPKQGYDYVRYVVQKYPYSIAAWNCYYKVISSYEIRFRGHNKFLNRMRAARKDCVMAMVINGHQFTMIKQHQAAAEEYLEAYKILPESPLINLCLGTALINLALGFRLQKKHYCVAQAFAFLYNYLRICHNSQEALYNIARAYQHVGLVTLAAVYYEKVLAIKEKDCPLPKLPYEESSVRQSMRPGSCSLHREAAYNLHLIYKKSGAIDLARQVLKNYCSF